MSTPETKQIAQMHETAERMKRELDATLKNMENKRSQDRAKLARDELALGQLPDSSMQATSRIRNLIQDAKSKMSDDHEVAELRRKRADIDKKSAAIKYWMSQSEYEDESLRQEAVNQARRTLESI